jgi:glucose-1-phosphatase
MAEIRNILFDLGNVIVDVDIAGTEARFLEMMRDDLDATTARAQLTRLIDAYETGVLSTSAFVTGILRDARPGVTADDVLEIWRSMIIGIPRYRLAMLEALRDRYSIIALSNTNTEHVDCIHTHLRDQHGIEDFERKYFHAVYYSHQIRRRKPDIAAFQYVIEDALITPEYTLFIDDLAENIHTARSLGFRVRQSPAHEEIAEVLKLTGYY